MRTFLLFDIIGVSDSSGPAPGDCQRRVPRGSCAQSRLGCVRSQCHLEHVESQREKRVEHPAEIALDDKSSDPPTLPSSPTIEPRQVPPAIRLCPSTTASASEEPGRDHARQRRASRRCTATNCTAKGWPSLSRVPERGVLCARPVHFNAVLCRGASQILPHLPHWLIRAHPGRRCPFASELFCQHCSSTSGGSLSRVPLTSACSTGGRARRPVENVLAETSDGPTGESDLILTGWARDSLRMAQARLQSQRGSTRLSSDEAGRRRRAARHDCAVNCRAFATIGFAATNEAVQGREQYV